MIYHTASASAWLWLWFCLPLTLHLPNPDSICMHHAAARSVKAVFGYFYSILAGNWLLATDYDLNKDADDCACLLTYSKAVLWLRLFYTCLFYMAQGIMYYSIIFYSIPGDYCMQLTHWSPTYSLDSRQTVDRDRSLSLSVCLCLYMFHLVCSATWTRTYRMYHQTRQGYSVSKINKQISFQDSTRGPSVSQTKRERNLTRNEEPAVEINPVPPGLSGFFLIRGGSRYLPPGIDYNIRR